MKKAILALGLLIIWPVMAAELSANAGTKTFAIPWLDGFSYRPAGQSQRWRGPNDELVIVTIGTSRQQVQPPELPKHIAQHMAFAEGKVPGLAGSKGAVTRDLMKEELSSGAILYSTATQTTQRFRDYFYLQFFHISPQADVALITVEGFGQSVAELFGIDHSLSRQNGARFRSLRIPLPKGRQTRFRRQFRI